MMIMYLLPGCFLTFIDFGEMYLGLVPPSLPAKKPSGIIPPKHWLMPQNDEKTPLKEVNSQHKETEIYEDLKQFFNSSSSASSSSVVSIFYSISSLVDRYYFQLSFVFKLTVFIFF